MHFQRYYFLDNLYFEDGKTIELSEESPHPISLVIRRAVPDEHPDVKSGAWIGILKTSEAISDNDRPHFKIASPPHQAVVEARRRVGPRMNDFVDRAVRVLRWYMGSTGDHQPIRLVTRMQWSDDGEAWATVPDEYDLNIVAGIPMKITTDSFFESFSALFNTGVSEPLANELFLEAWGQHKTSPRSSLLTGIAAAEVGFKSFVSALVPDAEWLAFNAPTPPLDKMLGKYLPLLPVKRSFGIAPFVPKELINIIREGIELRNKTAHAGATVPNDTLQKTLVAVRDLLYLLDVYCGQAWAWQNISCETQRMIKARVENEQGKKQN